MDAEGPEGRPEGPSSLTSATAVFMSLSCPPVRYDCRCVLPWTKPGPEVSDLRISILVKEWDTGRSHVAETGAAPGGNGVLVL